MQQAVRTLILSALLALTAPSVFAQTEPEPESEPEPEKTQPAPLATPKEQARDCGPTIGCSTKRPLPRYVSIKGAEARARRGPGNDHRVDWVYQRSGLPMKVTAEYENWRRVEDPEGAGGWMHYALLSTSRTAMITADMVDMTSKPEPGSGIVARAELGVIARILECQIDSCRLSRDGVRGWVPKTALWGVDAGEVFD